MIEFLFNNINQEIIRFSVSFLFVFAVIFGVLQTTKRRIKTDNQMTEREFFPQRVNIIISIVFGLVAAYYQPFSFLLFNILPYVTAFFLVIFFFIFLREVLRKEAGSEIPLMVSLGILLLVLGIVSENIRFVQLPFSLSAKDFFWIITLFLIAAIFYVASQKKG